MAELKKFNVIAKAVKIRVPARLKVVLHYKKSSCYEIANDTYITVITEQSDGPSQSYFQTAIILHSSVKEFVIENLRIYKITTPQYTLDFWHDLYCLYVPKYVTDFEKYKKLGV
jgi:hypothetical protein